jgi:SAM-dependent methyltransferase
MYSTRASVLLEKEEATRRYYDRNARIYADATAVIDMSTIYDQFLRYVSPRGRILDAGSGSGRDTRAFADRGYAVDAFDASPELCNLSTRLTGIRACVLRFQEFERSPRYDGVWACASLLHVPRGELPDAINRLVKALKLGGVLYTSFKYGSGERVAEDGRFYTDVDEQSLRDVCAAVPNLALNDVWTSTGEGIHRGKDAWLNAIALKLAEREDR